MDLDFYVRVRTCKKRVTGKQPLLLNPNHHILTKKIRGHVYIRVATHNVKSTLYVGGFSCLLNVILQHDNYVQSIKNTASVNKIK